MFNYAFKIKKKMKKKKNIFIFYLIRNITKMIRQFSFYKFVHCNLRVILSLDPRIFTEARRR